MKRERESDLLASIHPLLASCWAALDFQVVFGWLVKFFLFFLLRLASLSLVCVFNFCICELFFATRYNPSFSNVSGKFDSY